MKLSEMKALFKKAKPKGVKGALTLILTDLMHEVVLKTNKEKDRAKHQDIFLSIERRWKTFCVQTGYTSITNAFRSNMERIAKERLTQKENNETKST